jgi:3-isopropylmalate dehydratase small subunit
VIAPGFSDIFSGNAFKNGILTVELPRPAVDRLMEVARTDPIAIDLEHQTVTTPFQDRFAFAIDPFRKHCLLEGLDEVGLTLAMEPKIAAFEARQAPWLKPAI